MTGIVDHAPLSVTDRDVLHHRIAMTGRAHVHSVAGKVFHHTAVNQRAHLITAIQMHTQAHVADVVIQQLYVCGNTLTIEADATVTAMINIVVTHHNIRH